MSHQAVVPLRLILHKISRALEVVFPSGAVVFPADLLRSHSPSAENRHAGNNPGNYHGVSILSVEPVGHYAVRLLFSDGHRSGIFTWEMLYALRESIRQNEGE